jgi:long-chain acyl-CoA synthetase
VLVGDKKPYITALLTINLTNIKGLKNGNQTGIDQNELLHKAVKEAVARVNKQLADFERIRRFKVLERDFSIENGELTPTMKIRRARVLELHKDLVSELYLGREESE